MHARSAAPGLVVSLVVIAATSACGRHGFDPIGDVGAAADGAGGADDDGGGDGSDGSIESCVDDLSNVGTGDFEIRFTVQTTITGKTTLLFQRASCGNGPHWDVYLGDGGRAGLAVCEIADGASVASTPTQMPVDDGAPHEVVCRRVGGVLSVIRDGGAANEQSLPLALGALPAMGTATGHPCEDVQALVGSISDVCVRPL